MEGAALYVGLFVSLIDALGKASLRSEEVMEQAMWLSGARRLK